MTDYARLTEVLYEKIKYHHDSDIATFFRDNSIAILTAFRIAGKVEETEVAAERDVIAERRRQIEVEGRTPEHDDAHRHGELAAAAACYASPVHVYKGNYYYGREYFFGHWNTPLVLYKDLWPWANEDWKPKTRRQNLVRAGALILAEIERLDRAALRVERTET